MVTIIYRERNSSVLTPSSLACLSDIPTINLTSGCAHNCLYCYARGYSMYPGDNRIVIYSNILEKVEKELASKKVKPQAVYFSPSSDIFQPLEEVLELSHKILEMLLFKGIGVAIVTKGQIPEKTLVLLENYPDMVRIQIGIITDDDEKRHILEPDTAPVSKRLDQMRKLIDAGINVEARIVPVIPGITDSFESTNSLLQQLANNGIQRASASTLFMRPKIAQNLRKYMRDSSEAEQILYHYSSGRMSVRSHHSSVIPLTLSLRKDIYENLKRLAHKNGIEVSICGCMNPDIGGTCNISGTWLTPFENELQGSLFD